MKQRIIYIVIGLVIGALAAGATGYYFGAKQAAVQGINSYDECVAGYPVMDSYPEQCRTPDGRNFTNTARVVEQPVVFEGKIVCLPHVNTDGPQTLECMSGLQTNDGKYYLLGSGTSHELISAAGTVQVRHPPPST